MQIAPKHYYKHIWSVGSKSITCDGAKMLQNSNCALQGGRSYLIFYRVKFAQITHRFSVRLIFYFRECSALFLG